MVHPSLFFVLTPETGHQGGEVVRRPPALAGRWAAVSTVYRAGRYWALTAGAFLRAATHWLPLRSGVVLAVRTAPPAAIATATAAIVSSSGDSTITEMSYSPYE